MTVGRDRRLLLALALVIALTGIPALGIVARALQTGEIFSPASGHAQVIAQGVASLPEEMAWRAVFHSLEPGGAAEIPAGDAGFLLVDTGGVLVEGAGRSTLLAPAEAAFRVAGSSRLVAHRGTPDRRVHDRSGRSRRGGRRRTAASRSSPASRLPPPKARRDIDLVRDLLEPGESTTVIGNEAPVLVLVTLGTIRAEATDGSAASLRVGEAATFSGDIVLTAEGQAAVDVRGRGDRPRSARAECGGDARRHARGPATVGSVQVTVYACPPLVGADGGELRALPARSGGGRAATGRDRRRLAARCRPSTERQGLPTWTGLAGWRVRLPGGALQGRVRPISRAWSGGNRTAAARTGTARTVDGYVIPIGADMAEYALDVYRLRGQRWGAPPAAQAGPDGP